MEWHSLAGHSISLQGNFTLNHNPLVTVAGGLDAVLLVSLIVREQTEHPKIARGRSAKAAVSGRFDELHGLSDKVPM